MKNYEAKIALKKALYMSELNDLKLDIDQAKENVRVDIKGLILKASPIIIGLLGLLRGNKRMTSIAFKFVKYNMLSRYFGKFIKYNFLSKFLQKSTR